MGGKQSITYNEEFKHCHLVLAEAENERYILCHWRNKGLLRMNVSGLDRNTHSGRHE